MVYNTLPEALDALSALTTTGEALKADLLELVKQTSIHAEGAATVLYSGNASGQSSGDIIGNLLDSGQDIRVINETVASNLLKSEDFQRKVAEAFGINFSDLENRAPAATDANNWLFHSTDGPWADASGRFSAASTGDIRIIAAEGNPARILAETELTALLDNPAVTHIRKRCQVSHSNIDVW